MKSLISEIIETILFAIALYIILAILLYSGINFNFFYVFGGMIVVWVVVKMIFRRLNHKKKNEIDKET